MSFTYTEVGRTRNDDLPAGYRHVRRHAVVGQGDATFRAVVAGMRDFGIHRLAGMRIRTHGAPRLGSEFQTGLGFSKARLWVPCRIVWFIDTPAAYGYGFGTMPGHPERGEEAFEVTPARQWRGALRYSCVQQPGQLVCTPGRPGHDPGAKLGHGSISGLGTQTG